MTLARDLPCVALAVDPGDTSGWALTWVPPALPAARVWETGTATAYQRRAAVVADACDRAQRLELPLVVVAETWLRSGGKHGIGLAAVAGLGAQWGKWLAEFERLDVPAKRIIRVDTGTWGQVVLGRSRMTTEQRRAASMMRARAVLGHDVTHDEAAALCIGLWALRAEKVAAAIGKRELRRLGWSEVG